MDVFAAQLTQQGYCVVPGVLNEVMLDVLRRRFSAAALADVSDDNFGASGGLMVADYHDPLVARLLAWPQTLAALSALGFSSPKLHNFYLSTKPPGAAALAWHSDLFYRYDKPEPAELFLIYYLTDTTPDNGCLRVVPGSHTWPHDVRHTQTSAAAARSDEVAVPVTAGDLFVGDRRILHATYANASDTWRTCVTIAYAPLFDTLDEPIKALIVQNRCLPPAGWWHAAKKDIDPGLQRILPIYDGSARPVALAG